MSLPSPILAGGLSYALREATLPGLLVVVVLLLVSSYSWSVMVTKSRALRRSEKASREFLAEWRNGISPLTVYASGKRFENSPHYRVYVEGCQALTLELLGEHVVDERLPARLAEAGNVTPLQMETIHLCMQKAVGETSLRLESQTALLATAVSGGPFLGLLGTVWGVMDTFSGIAESSSSASIKDMAPGVAAALVTTVVGLLVAIPAMFGYNWMISKIRTTVVSVENFSAEFAAAMNREWLEGVAKPAPPSLPTLRPATIASRAMEQASVQPAVAAKSEDEPIPDHSAAGEVPHETTSPRHRQADPESGFSEDT